MDYNYNKNRENGQQERPEQGQVPPGYQSPWQENRPYDSAPYDARPGTGSYNWRSRPPYQYNTGSDWQGNSGPDRYQWNFADYDQAMAGKKKSRKSRGLVVFAVSLLCVLSLGLLTLTGYSIVKTLSGGEVVVELPPAEASGPTPSVPKVSPGDDVTMNIAEKPQVEEPPIVPGERMTIPQVARSVRPSVVGIINYQSGQIFEPFTEGSGIVLSKDGYIVTNQHVIQNAEAIVVVFDDGTEYEAALVGADARTDLAVIKVDRDDLIPAVLGNSDDLEVGETVIAIGNPGGTDLAGSVTRGIISALNRVVKTPYYSTNYIQTDAAINPGNSGGALCNEFGQVVGINSAKIVAEGYEGISFAIPITEAVPIVEDLIAYGRVIGRVMLGITGEPVSEIIARNRNVPAGVQIITITSEELARKGAMRGDIITHIDDVRVLDLNDVRTIVESHQAGDVVKLTLYRQTRVNTNNHTFEIKVALLADTGE
ncbi:MAG: S1C family serine protease [Oscillospiraceae bacterium]|jgi:serine protease Do